MGPVATLTYDRGDRPQFMDFCKVQIDRMKVDAHCIVDYHPIDSQVDLIPRFKKGLREIKAAGIDNVIIVESDDFYPIGYENLFDFDRYDFMGWMTTTYYNVRQKAWETYHHYDHSSLFCTAFKISALGGFKWPPDNYLWLDIAIWKFAKQNSAKWILREDENPTLGIKHGVGKVGGKGHRFELKNKDSDLSYLRSKTDDVAFEFYSKLKL